MTTPAETEPGYRGIRVIRLGSGANCSSIGSVVDTLFATAAVGGAILVAVAGALARESAIYAEKKAKTSRDDDSHEGAADGSAEPADTRSCR